MFNGDMMLHAAIGYLIGQLLFDLTVFVFKKWRNL
jgi:hypothetical protein